MKIFKQAKRIFQVVEDLISTNNKKLVIVTDGAAWVIDEVSYGICDNLSRQDAVVISSIVPFLLRGKIIHFINRYLGFDLKKIANLHPFNKLISIWWHGGAYSVEHEELNELTGRVSEASKYLDKIQITSSLYFEVLKNSGVPEDKIVHLPMGINLERFTLKESKQHYKKLLGIPQDKFCIGYFQRDGDEKPKLIKGPDVFIDFIKKLFSKRDDIFVLLTGPKRGYVIRNLSDIDVPFKYLGVLSFDEMPFCYGASDLYVVSSREEGGPASVLECMATGVPLISTKVGMAADLIENGENGFLVDIESSDGLVECALKILDNPNLRTKFVNNGRVTVANYDWKVLVKRYEEVLYKNWHFGFDGRSFDWRFKSLSKNCRLV